MTNKRTITIDWSAYLLVAPTFLLFIVAVIFPVVETVRYSFVRWNGLTPMIPVGLGNYAALLRDSSFHSALGVTVIWTVATTVLSVGIGTTIAILSGLIPQKSEPYRLAIFAAYSISAVASGIMWQGIYHPTVGLLNGALEFAQLSGLQRAWLGDPNMALWAVIVAYVWTQVGLPVLTVFASVQSIPKTLFEASIIDGAGSWSLIWHIMLPLSRPGIRVATFITILNSLKAFDLIFVLTRGGPLRSTETIGYFMYHESMFLFKLGYGATSVVVLTVAVMIAAIPMILDRSENV